MFCDGIRKIARRKENSSLDCLHEATLDVLYLCFSDVRKWRFVQANRSELPVVEVGQSRFGDFK